jgi:hypothetical protein
MNLIGLIKIFDGFDNLDARNFFQFGTAPTWGHGLKLAKSV